MRINYGRKVFVKKKYFAIGIALIMLFTTVSIAFADVGVSYTDNSVAVWNTGKGKLSKVELCVIYMDAANVRRETSMDFFNVTSIKQKKSFNLGKVMGAYSTYCPAPTLE
jgi:hypothetical protein